MLKRLVSVSSHPLLKKLICSFLEKQNSLQEYEAERIRLTIGQKNLLEILHQLNILNTTFDDITGRLSSIQYIWHIVC